MIKEKEVFVEKPLSCISGSTQIFGIIGDPVSHSLSPLIWNHAFNSLKLNAVYVPFCVKKDYLESAIKGLQILGIKGINVTAPHKKYVAKLCNILHSPADFLLATNTIKFSESSIDGWNTDATAIKSVIEKHGNFSKATVLGNGNTTKSALWALSRHGIKNLNIIFRRPKKEFSKFAEELFSSNATELPWTKENISESVSTSDIVINTTSLGREKGDKISGLSESISNNAFYIDLNYLNGIDISSIAVNNNCKSIDGKEILLQQAAEGFFILTGEKIPEKILMDIQSQLLNQTK